MDEPGGQLELPFDRSLADVNANQDQTRPVRMSILHSTAICSYSYPRSPGHGSLECQITFFQKRINAEMSRFLQHFTQGIGR